MMETLAHILQVVLITISSVNVAALIAWLIVIFCMRREAKLNGKGCEFRIKLFGMVLLDIKYSTGDSEEG